MRQRIGDETLVENGPTSKRIRPWIIPVAAATVFGAECVLHLSGLFSEETRWMAGSFTTLPLKALLLLALADGINSLRTPGERRFWALALAAFASWFIADMAFQTGDERPLFIGILEDGAFLLFYPLLMVAIEQRPCRYHWPITGWGSRFLCACSGLLLIVWSYVYFVGLTLLYVPDVFLSEAPSYAFFTCADFIFATAFFIRMLINHGRWRLIYGLLSLAMTGWGVTDLLDTLGLLGADVIEYGTPLDIVWSLPYYAVIGAAVYRNRTAAKTPPLPVTTTHGGTLVFSGYAYVVGIAVIHLVVFLTEWLREIEVAREVTVAAGLTILIAIAVAIQSRERRRRKFTHEPRIIVLEDEEQQVQKMEALGRLAGGVAHDFNNLLMVLQSQIDTRLDQLHGLPDGEKFISELQTVVHRGSDLSRQLLAFGRKQVGEVRVIDPVTIIGETESMLRRTVGEHIELEISSSDDVWPIAIDPGQVTQILINLTLNARSAMPDGGQLRIHVENVTIDHGDVDAVKGEQYVQITVQDTGRGMDERTRSRVFEPFFSNQSTASGTGLGMAVVYGIVKQHGGHITCESTEDAGTTFRVHFPRCKEAREETPTVKQNDIRHPAGDETILVVEDETDVRSAVSDYLRSKGYQVVEASDGVDALEIANEIDGPIDLLLSDIVMPKMGGPELADRLSAVRPNTPVLFVTGYAEDLPLTTNGATTAPVLQKPYSLLTLETRIREILDRD